MESPEYYAKCFAAASRHSTYIEANTNWIKLNIPEIVQKVLETGDMKDGGKLKILSIGPGTGLYDVSCNLESMLSTV